MAKPIKLTSSKELKSGSAFVKAASGVAYLNDSLYVIQDSSRFLAKFSPSLDNGIQFIRLAPQERINVLEDPTKSFEDYRRDRRADFEAITTLPDGRLLVLGSGYDAHNIGTQKDHYRNIGVIFNPKSEKYEEFSLDHFYRFLLDRTDFVGVEKNGIKPRLNIEGVAVFDNTIAFFHRSNFAKNNHDAMMAFDLAAWLKEIQKKDKWSLKETSVHRLDFGSITFKGQQVPITLNDAIFSEGHFILPVACETDTIVNGKDVDGEVIWNGIAKLHWKEKSCEMFQFSDTRMPKIEGIAADTKNPGRFFLVHDADSEVLPSLLSEVLLPRL